MNEDDIIYGVGESNRGINKNIGMHRYGGTWTGDNKSWWSHILLNLKMMPSLNMCGFLYTGADPDVIISEEILEKGMHYVEIALNEVSLFIWEGKCIPVAEVAESVEQIDTSKLTMIGFDGAEYLLYDDDGVGKDYVNEEKCRKMVK